MSDSSKGASRAREAVAEEAARLMVDHGIRDYALAKSKAANRLGYTVQFPLPKNREVDEKRRERLQIFDEEGTQKRRAHFCRIALDAIRILADFEPRVSGDCAEGLVSDVSTLEIHLFADTPEDVVIRLVSEGIPYRERVTRFKEHRKQKTNYPTFSCVADDVPVDFVVFPVKGIRQPPLSPIDGRPVRRLNQQQVLAVLNG